MEELYYIGLDLHKKIIAYCIKTANGVIVSRFRFVLAGSIDTSTG